MFSCALSKREVCQDTVVVHCKSEQQHKEIQQVLEILKLSLQFSADTAVFSGKEKLTHNLIVKGESLKKEWIASAMQVSIGLIEIMGDHEKYLFSKHDLHSILSVVKVLVDCRSYEDYIDLVKYSTTYLHARSLKQKVLPSPPPSWLLRARGGKDCPNMGTVPILFLGSMRRYLRNRLVTQSDKNQHLFWSIAQLKRCAEVVPDSQIQKSLVKHRSAMLKGTEPCKVSFLTNIKEKFDNLIEGMTFSKVSTINEYSTSACWENTTICGGAKSELLYDHVQRGYTTNDELLKMSYHPRSGVTQRRGFVSMDMETMIEDTSLDRCRAKVYPIAEPLKIRNITKSNAAPYAIAKGLQLDIHSYMKKFFQFALIGEPMENRHIEELVRRSPEGSFASGDFSAATDNVKIELTKLFFERILFRLQHQNVISYKHTEILRNVLYEHEIHYPLEYGPKQTVLLPNGKVKTVKLLSDDDLSPVTQVNGQLMGSVLSFPVLCAINLCAYWISVEPEVEDFRDLNVMINGDDILFRTTPEKYQNWLDLLPETGLSPSPGKNFFHERYCTVNSILFSVTKQQKQVVKQIPFYNVGMLLGQSKVSGKSKKQKPIHCLHEDVLVGALNPVRADERFRFYNKEKLIRSTKSADGHQMNFYICRELGGLGMKVPGLTYISAERMQKLTYEELEVLKPYTIVSGVQRKIAKYLHTKWTEPYFKPPMKPIGQEIDEDKDNNNFVDIPDDTIKILIEDKMCPMPPWCREKESQYHPPNWCVPASDSAELERLKFEAKGVRLYRSSKMKVPCNSLNNTYTEYKWVGEDNWKQSLLSPQLETVDGDDCSFCIHKDTW